MLAVFVLFAVATAQASDRGLESDVAAPAMPPVHSFGIASQLLASLPGFTQEGFAATVTSVAFVLTEDAGGFAWGAGYGLFHSDGDANTYNFTAANDPDFPHMAALLTNGIDDSLAMYDASNLGGGSASSGYESGFLGANPDFLGNATDSIALVIHDLHIYRSGGVTWVSSNYTWQVRGHPLFAFFTPPSDPDGAYVFQRDSSNVSIYLRSPGIAVLSWDGMNRTMRGDGEDWYLNVTGLTNGNHTLRVWATDNGTGTLHATEPRTITLGYRLWAVERVTRALNPSLALDSRGAIRACYGDYSGGIHYAARNESGWEDTLVDTVWSGDSGCSLVLDSADHAYVSYGGLKFALFDGASWRTETVSTSGEGLWSSLALNPMSGTPMIAYYDKNARALFLANRSNGVWSSEVVDSSSDTGWMPSLAIDVDGNPHIAYFNDTGRVAYAVRSGGSWTIQTVDNIGRLGGIYKISLALDSAGDPRIAYVGGGSDFGAYGYGGLKYANWTGSAWQIQTVDSGPVSAVSLALDTLGHPRIAYSLIGQLPYAVGLNDLRYAAWNEPWEVETLSGSADAGGLALRLTSAGSPIIMFPYLCCPNGTDERALDFAARGDIEPPVVQVNVSGDLGNGGWYLSPVKVTLNASDTGSGVASVSYQVDDGAWQMYAGPFLIVTNGSHTIGYRATDVAGNTAAEMYAMFRVDATPPSSSVQVEASAGSAGWYTSNATATLTAVDAASGLASISYRVDGGAWQMYDSPFTLRDGVHVLEYRATDSAGNLEIAHTQTINVDTVAPIVSGLAPSGVVTTSQVTVSWTGTDGGSGIARYEVSVDSSPFQSVGTATSTSLTLSDGVHDVRVRAVDTAGNAAELATSLRVDTNIFSFTGPYSGIPTLLLIGLTAAAFSAWMWERRKKRKLSP